MNDEETEFGLLLGVALKARTADVATPAGLATRVQARAKRRRRRRLAGRAALVLSVVGALNISVVAVRHTDQRIQTSERPSDGNTSGWFLPADTTGLRQFFAQVLKQGLDYSAKYRILLAVPNDTGGYRSPVVVQFGDTARVHADTTSTQLTSESIEVAGHPGSVIHDSVNGTIVVQYDIDDARTIAISSSDESITPEPLLLEIASALDISGPRTLEVTRPLPEGFRIVVEGDMTGSSGAAALLTFAGIENNQQLLNIEVQASAPAGYELFGMLDAMAPVTVRGVDGWYTTSSGPKGQPATSRFESGAVFWRTPAGQVVSVSGSGFSEEQLIETANALHEVPQAEWLAFARQFPTQGPGLDQRDTPPLIAFPQPPPGYRLQSALYDPSPTVERYAVARYVPIISTGSGQALEVRSIRTTPEAWQQQLDTTFAGRPTWSAGGRALIDVSAEPPSSDGTSDHRTVAEQWIKGIVVELDASTTDGSPLDTTLDFDELRRLAATLNDHPDTFGITTEPATTDSSANVTTAPRGSSGEQPPETVPVDSSMEPVRPGG